LRLFPALTVTLFTGTVMPVTEAASQHSHSQLALTIDELARRVALPVRTIREYQTLGLLPSPIRNGRVGLYHAGHEHRLLLIKRLQGRGYSLAGIRDLLESWRDGDDLGAVLGLAADELVHDEEPGTAAKATQLAELLPQLVPDRLDELLATGVVEACGSDDYCVPSPSLLELVREALAVGYPPDAVLRLVGEIAQAARSVADSVVEEMAARPVDARTDDLISFATRARGLIAHGTGRLTIHAIGKRLGITDDAAMADGLQRLLEDEVHVKRATRSGDRRTR
jgi:DNA-binding transcriptional MerR regulator